MRRPYPQPSRLGKRLARCQHGLGVVWVMDRYRGLRLLACGPARFALCDWVFLLLNSEETRVRKPSVVDSPDGNVPMHGSAGAGMGKVPKVLEWLTAPRYEDGTPRRGGWLGLSAEGGVWKVLMKEPSAGLMMRVEVKTLDLLWPTLEVILGEKVVPWQTDERADVNGKKGKKRGS